MKPEGKSDRRKFIRSGSGLAMLAGLAGGYGLFAYIAGRFLYPAGASRRRWMFVAREDDLGTGDSVLYRAPNGETISVTRQGANGDASDFLALSSTCPHLGCQVHWEPLKNRYFCPCHNGVFSPEGKGVSGPPGDAGLDLMRFNLKLSGGLLFIEVPVESIASNRDVERIDRVEGIHGPGHDPCLAAAARSRAGRTEGAS